MQQPLGERRRWQEFLEVFSNWIITTAIRRTILWTMVMEAIFATVVIIDNFNIYSFGWVNYWSLTAMAEKKLTQITTKLSFMTQCCWNVNWYLILFQVLKMFDISTDIWKKISCKGANFLSKCKRGIFYVKVFCKHWILYCMSLHSSLVMTSFGRALLVSMYNVYRLYSLPLENVSTMNCSRASLAEAQDRRGTESGLINLSCNY